MPNHITNIVRVLSDNTKQNQKALMSMMTTGGNVDFNRLIPMPTILLKTSSPNTINPMECIEQTGHADWYTWSSENWGTKWNGYETHFEGLYNLPFKRWHRKTLKKRNSNYRRAVDTCYVSRINKKRFKSWVEANGLPAINFDTAWGCPRPVFVALSKKFPALKFEITYADEDVGSNCGRYVLMNGNVISTKEAGRWTSMSEEEQMEWRLFAMKIKGYSPADIKEYLEEM